MSRSTLYVITHIHTDGPIPGPHSLLTLTSSAHTPQPGRGPIGTFGVNLRELTGATVDPAALQTWRRHPDDWLASRRSSRAPAIAMGTYLRWVDRLPGEPVFVADSAGPDYLFLFWYLQRFAGRWPFAGTRTEPGLYHQFDCTALCPLTGCRTRSVRLARTS